MGNKQKLDKLNILLAEAKKVKMSEDDREEQRRSFAYGNTKFENEYITRQMVNEAADKEPNP